MCSVVHKHGQKCVMSVWETVASADAQHGHSTRKVFACYCTPFYDECQSAQRE